MRMNAIVAVCGEPGKTALAIGARGQLAWNIPAEMKHFAHLTKTTKDKSKQNVVLMGALSLTVSLYDHIYRTCDIREYTGEVPATSETNQRRCEQHNACGRRK